MKLSHIEALYAQAGTLQATITAIQQHSHTQVKGLLGSSQPLFISALFDKYKQTILAILPEEEEAGYFYQDISQIRSGGDVLFFPSSYRRATKYGQTDSANEILRMEALAQLQKTNSPIILVTYPRAICERVVTRQFFTENTLKLQVGDQADSVHISQMLSEYGFEQVDYVYEPGQFAVRGSILDVFSFSNEYPYRIDFFGDEVDTIRTFEVDSQLSRNKEQEIFIIPQSDGKDTLSDSLFNTLPKGTLVVYKNYEQIEQQILALFTDHPILNNPEYDQQWQNKLISDQEFASGISRYHQLLLSNATPSITPHTVVEWPTALQPVFRKNFDLIASTLKSYLSQQYQIYILSDSLKQIERLKEIFADRKENIHFHPIEQTLHEGFTDHLLKICCFTDHQIFDRYHKYTLKSEKARSGKVALSLKELQQFQIGDYVVHIDHGIGKFGGLVRMETNGNTQEMIKLFYHNNDTLLVSIHSLHKISKYKGKEGHPPRIHKLGTSTWGTMKERTKKKVKDIARDLIALYAKRREEKGYSFTPDSFLQKELEASFLYEDTPDQIKATQEVKHDMESNRPMDRLICGDVGFGKTEIAIRAAFKAVADNKQVAVLVPTTILATQHFQTFSRRLKNFPCKIAYLSRAKKSAEIRETLKAVAEGEINILIGTHRIVSKDIIFKDLGLLIIDEEQKFGVATKEKLKQLRTHIDTLTMTATPIPRTLQFSLMGARDLSTITTPPPNRHPVQTELHAFDSRIIKEAINFEMSRNGQVFVINNRVKNIYEIEHLIRQEVPDARIAVGHGQMNPKELENIIEDFANHEYDILIATSIIESGIDIPNANTIIINNAQNFGLSDLHQFRGRVGRSNKKAFCYLMTPAIHTLTDEARRRLQAIENFSELGSGLHIAMQDLDIRGAGNMLGAEQSGFIADLGYETYQRILSEAIEELKNEEFTHIYSETKTDETPCFVSETTIESDMELLLPQTYVPSDTERISLYRELDALSTEAQVDAFTEKLKDRFGNIPHSTQELIKVVELKQIAKQLGMEKIKLRGGKMTIRLVENKESAYYQSTAFEKILRFLSCHTESSKITEKNNKPTLIISKVASISEACNTLKQIQQSQ